MKRNQLPTLSSFGKEGEQLTFGLGVRERTATGTIFMLNELILLDSSNLSHQFAYRISPTPEFQSHLYFRANSTKQEILEFPTHPDSQSRFTLRVTLPIDEHDASLNSTERLAETVILFMRLGITDSSRSCCYVGVSPPTSFALWSDAKSLDVLPQIHLFGESQASRADRHDETYDRQIRISGLTV